jgi:hypothetical protein
MYTIEDISVNFSNMIYPFEFPFRFMTIRILNPRTNKVIMEAQRAVEYNGDIPDWESVDTIVSLYLETHGIETFERLAEPRLQTGGGWITHTFDLGSPRLVWIFPDPDRGEGAV